MNASRFYARPLARVLPRLLPMTATLSTALLVNGCVAPPRMPAPVDVPSPTPTIVLPRPAPVEWQDWPRTPGNWTYQRDARGSRALFGIAGQDALVVLRCDQGERRLFLSRSGAATAPFTIRTTSTTRSLPAQPTGGTPPYVATAFAPTDPLLDAMAFSRGRFVIEQAGMPALVLPPYAEIGRVIEDCRG